jgi:hypothetical protein
MTAVFAVSQKLAADRSTTSNEKREKEGLPDHSAIKTILLCRNTAQDGLDIAERLHYRPSKCRRWPEGLLSAEPQPVGL